MSRSARDSMAPMEPWGYITNWSAPNPGPPALVHPVPRRVSFSPTVLKYAPPRITRDPHRASAMPSCHHHHHHHHHKHTLPVIPPLSPMPTATPSPRRRSVKRKVSIIHQDQKKPLISLPPRDDIRVPPPAPMPPRLPTPDLPPADPLWFPPMRSFTQSTVEKDKMFFQLYNAQEYIAAQRKAVQRS
ncbi:hypothetical protein B0H63DRAFT_490164 [Podospora didyma]|uniref:Uncharacterized protein n=1 Tax=Podospora didyma TaxID=330526 RepID=A0AAE0N2S9_9PEZI|nr:hypothetical protein B0H63DRAFT_490164 [Podospora didyma]